MLWLSCAGCGGSTVRPVVENEVTGGCANLDRYVSVGGTAGFNALGKPNFVTGLLATGRVRLYEHGVAVASAITGSPRSHPYSILNAIEAEFTGTGPGEAEVGLVGPNYFTLPASGYPQYFQYQFVNSALNPNAANVDVPSEPPSAIRFTPANIRAWTAWVRAGKSAGIRSMAPIVAPNAAWERGNPIFPPTHGAYYDVNSSFYRLSRFEALSGGAIAFDSPPKFFLSGGSGPGYQAFIEQAIRWGNAHGLRTTVLISPYAGRSGFTQDTQRFVSALVNRDAVPSEWAVDDYENTNPNDASAMGPDTSVDTSTNVALWLASNAPVFAHGVVCHPSGSQSPA
jgi:hypothetical protein